MKAEVFGMLHVVFSMKVANTQESLALQEAAYKLTDIQHIIINTVLSDGVLNLTPHNVEVDLDSLELNPE